MSLTARIRAAVAELAEVDVSPYKGSVLLRRARARAREGGRTTVEEYVAALEQGGPWARREASTLVQSLYVRVSEFFRDPAVFRALEELVYPRLWDRPPGAGPVRVWSAACAAGQEAYSLAISLLRAARALGRPPEIEVLGTDVDERALRTAEGGVYPGRALARVPEEVRAGAFEAAGPDRWAVAAHVRRRVRFERRDVLDREAHPSGLDLIACRNLLIYLDRPVQEELILAFERDLRPGGFLVLGASETILGRPWGRFEHVSPSRRVYRKPPAGVP